MEVSPLRAQSSHQLVLVVEDHEDTRFMLSMLLQMRGYKVLEVGDGGEAVGVAERERPSLILMDGTLPGLNGLAATRRMRGIQALQNVPIIFLSGQADPAFRNVAFAAGCDEYLDKPINFDRLDDVLDRHLKPSEGIEAI